MAMTGNIEIDSIVAQGCKPVGDIMTVTAVGSPSFLIMGDPYSSQPERLLTGLDYAYPDSVKLGGLASGAGQMRENVLFRKSLFIGVEKDVFTENPGYGDFLIRNIIGVDTESGALAIGAELEAGQLVQFHLRDQYTSAEDLNTMLSEYVAHADSSHAEGAMLFTCQGRGVGLYGERCRSDAGERPVFG